MCAKKKVKKTGRGYVALNTRVNSSGSDELLYRAKAMEQQMIKDGYVWKYDPTTKVTKLVKPS